MQQTETITIPTVVAQMVVIFCIWHYVVCTDISNKHTATIFRVCEMCHVNAEVMPQEKMCQSHRNSQLSLAQDNPSSSSHPPQLWLTKFSQNFLHNTYFIHHITSATIWSHYEDRGSILSQNIRKFNLWLNFLVVQKPVEMIIPWTVYLMSWNRSKHVLNEFSWFCDKWTNECLVVL